MAGLRIHLRHVRAVDPAAGPLCTPSIRAWCRQHGIDLRALCEDGETLVGWIVIGTPRTRPRPRDEDDDPARVLRRW